MIYSSSAASGQQKRLHERRLLDVAKKFKDDVAQLEADVARLEAEVASKSAANTSLESQLQCLTAKFQNALKDLASNEEKWKKDQLARADRIKQLELQIESLNTLKARADDRSDEGEESRKKLVSLQQQLSELKSQLEISRAEKANLAGKLAKSESHLFNADMTKGASNIPPQRSAVGQPADDLTSLRSQTAVLQNDLDHLANLNSQSATDVKRLEAKVSQLESEKAALRERQEEMEAQLARLENAPSVTLNGK